jgi:hypothetical protein
MPAQPLHTVTEPVGHVQVGELQSRMSRFHGLTAANPERKIIAAAVTDGCESLKWQVGCDPGSFCAT